MSQDLSKSAEYSKNIKDGFREVFKYASELEMATIPFLNIPIISHIFKYLYFKITDNVFEYARLTIFFKYIDMRSVDQKNEYIKSIDKFRLAKESGDKNEIKKSMVEMFNHIDDFYRFNRI